jgi:predicted nucleic acid-binding Zn ribbon protein
MTTTSNATRPTKTKSGGAHHCNQLKNLKEEHAALLKKSAALKTTFSQTLGDLELLKRKEAHTAGELRDVKKDYIRLLDGAKQLKVEACRSVMNYEEAKRYRRQRNIMIGIAAFQVVLICIAGLR